MKRILQILGILILILFLSLSAAWFFARPYLEAKAREQVVAMVRTHVSSFDLGQVRLVSFFPLKVQLLGIKFAHGPLTLEAMDQMTIEVGLIQPVWIWNNNGFRVLVETNDYKLNFVGGGETVTSSTEEVSSSKISPSVKVFGWPVSFQLRSSGGQVRLKFFDMNLDVNLEGIQLQMEKSNVLDFSQVLQFDLGFLTTLNYQGMSLKLPVRLQSTDLLASPTNLRAGKLMLDLAGLRMDVAGSSDLVNADHNWQGQFSISELAQLPTPPDFLPPGQWTGSVQGRALFQQKSGGTPYVGVSLVTSALRGQVDYLKDQLLVRGPLSAQVQLQAAYTNALTIQKLQANVDLSAAQVKYDQFLTKPPRVPLRTEVSLKMSNHKIDVAPSSLEFHNLKGQFGGNLSFAEGQSSNFSLRVPSTTLKGMEKLIPIVSSYPVNGKVALEAAVKGNFAKTEDLLFQIKSYELNQVSAVVKYQDSQTKVSVEGPFLLSSRGHFTLFQKNLKDASVNLSFTGDQMQVQWPELMQKKKNDLLRIQAAIKGKGEVINLLRSHILVPGLDMGLSGQIAGLEKPKINLDIEVKSLKTDQLMPLFPTFKDLGYSPQVNGRLQLKGVYDRKIADITEQDLAVNGRMQVYLPLFKIKSSDEGSEAGERPVKVEVTNQPLLPSWPVLKKSKVDIDLKVDHFYYDQLHASQISLLNRYQKGLLSARGKIASLYGGSVEVGKAELNLLEVNPVTEAQLKVNSVQAQGLVGGLFPEYKDEVQGVLTLFAAGKLPFPRGKGWTKKIILRGDLSLQRAFLRTFRFDELINENLAKIPGVGAEKTVNSKGVAMSVSSKYDIKDGVIRLANFNFITPERNQLTCGGAIDFDLEANLHGKAYLVNAPVRGSIYEANKDEQGRLVVPVSIRGNLLSPKFSIVRETIDNLLSNAIRYETKKVQSKAREELKKRAEEEKQKLKEKLKNKVKGLFDGVGK